MPKPQAPAASRETPNTSEAQRSQCPTERQLEAPRQVQFPAPFETCACKDGPELDFTDNHDATKTSLRNARGNTLSQLKKCTRVLDTSFTTELRDDATGELKLDKSGKAKVKVHEAGTKCGVEYAEYWQWRCKNCGKDLLAWNQEAGKWEPSGPYRARRQPCPYVGYHQSCKVTGAHDLEDVDRAKDRLVIRCGLVVKDSVMKRTGRRTCFTHYMKWQTRRCRSCTHSETVEQENCPNVDNHSTRHKIIDGGYKVYL